MQLPAPLRPGDAVRIVAPAGVFDQEKLLAGVACLSAAGLVPRYDDGIFAKARYLAGDDARRTEELRRALVDPEIKAVWTARGGFGATRIVTSFDPSRLMPTPRWLVGFSDTTALHALLARAGIASMHGPNVTTLPTWSEAARNETFALLARPAKTTYQGSLRVPGARASGTLLGGNLTVLAAMVGTAALPSFAGAIVLLEDVGERPYRLDRSLTQLVQAGAFAGARGFVIGQLTGCEEAVGNEWTALEVITDVLAPLGLPVLGGLPFGHEASARAVLLGVAAELDARAGTLVVGS
jgi:muramoyltetrapeptide carboxypeptidase